jgi:ankyrin repeat protein
LQKYIDSGTDLNSLDENGMTPLHFASDRGAIDIINLLLDNGAQIDSVNDEGQTSLMYAIICEHIEIVKLLLEKNANLKIISTDGSTAISLGKDSIEDIALLFEEY